MRPSIVVPAAAAATIASLSMVLTSSALSIVIPGMTAIERESKVTLVRIAETRSMNVGDNEDDPDAFMMPAEEPALTLTFEVTMPAGTRIMSIEQPQTVTASDSQGTDLSRITPGFDDELEYVELEHDFEEEDDKSELTFRLLPSSRQAVTFSVQATFQANAYTGSKPLTLEVGEAWLAVNDEAVAGLDKPLRLRLRDEGLEVEPASAEAWIEEIAVQTDANEAVGSHGWFSDGQTITYLFDELPDQPPAKIILTLRTGVQQIPIAIDVKDQKLP